MQMFATTLAIIAISVLLFFTGLSVGLEYGYEDGYKQGQIDYQRGKVSYIEVETTTKVVQRTNQ